MKEQIIVPVDERHRIVVEKKYNGNRWFWYVLKQEKILSLFWLSSSWGGSNLFLRVDGFAFKGRALEEAEQIKNIYLGGLKETKSEV